MITVKAAIDEESKLDAIIPKTIPLAINSIITVSFKKVDKYDLVFSNDI